MKFGNENIGGMSFGSVRIGGAKYGDTLVYTSGPVSTAVSYIRGGADGSYIDTGITPDSSTKVIVWARNFNSGCGALFGSQGDSSTCFWISASGGTASNHGRIYIAYGTWGSPYVSATDQFKNFGGYHKYELYQGAIKIDDETVASTSTSFSGNSRNIFLFGQNNAGTVSTVRAPIDICACKIYKNGVLVRDFTAVNSPSVGLYDAISGTLFTNAGNGSFTYGEFDKKAYTPLEYIECNGSQYFDSGVYGSYADNIVSKFMPTNTTPQWTGVLGIWGNNSSCAISLGTATSGQDNMRCYLRIGPSNSGGTAFNGSTSNKLTNKSVVAIKINDTLTLFYNNSQIGTYTQSGVASTFVTSGTMRVGMNNPDDAKFIGRLYYVSFGSSRNFIPAKVSGVAGMYETYNDVFYPSLTETPFVAGPETERLPTHYFRGKNLAIIGDSISTYSAEGYKYDSYSMYYPYGEVNSVEYTYWKMLMNDENATLEVNLSYSGSCACSRSGYVSLNDRIGLVGNADTVIIALGTNDSAQAKPLGDYLYDTPYSDLGETNFREAYIKGIKGLLAANPNIDIVCAIFSMGADYRSSIKTIAAHYNLKCIDCGNDYAKVQGVHPNISGMEEIEHHFLYD